MRRRAAELSGSSLYYYYAKLLVYCHVINGTSLYVTCRDAINVHVHFVKTLNFGLTVRGTWAMEEFWCNPNHISVSVRVGCRVMVTWGTAVSHIHRRICVIFGVCFNSNNFATWRRYALY